MPGQGGQTDNSQNIQVSFSVRSPTQKHLGASPKSSSFKRSPHPHPAPSEATNLNLSINTVTQNSPSPRKPPSPKASSPKRRQEPSAPLSEPGAAYYTSDSGEYYSQQAPQPAYEPPPQQQEDYPPQQQGGEEDVGAGEAAQAPSDGRQDSYESLSYDENPDAGGGGGEGEATLDYYQSQYADGSGGGGGGGGEGGGGYEAQVEDYPPPQQPPAEEEGQGPRAAFPKWKQKSSSLHIQTDWSTPDPRKIYVAPPADDNGPATGTEADALSSLVMSPHTQDVYDDYTGENLPPAYWAQIQQEDQEEDDDSDADEKEENLGDDFEETPWLPPSDDKACKHRARRVYLEAKAPMCQKADFTDLGMGMRLYFSFLRTLIVLYIFLVIFNLPALSLYSSGQRISEEYRDFLGFYAYTLGNMGVASGDGTLKASQAGMTFQRAGGVIAAFDFLSCVAFLIAVAYLGYRLRATRTKSKNVTVKDFAVYVKGFPKNTSKKELIDHFSELYPLNQADWRQRAPPIGREKVPVLDVTNTGDEKYLATWIAEVALARRNGAKLRTMLSNDEKARKLKRCRAFMKMYAEDTPLRGGKGADDVLYAVYEGKLNNLGGEMEQIMEGLSKDKNRLKHETDVVGAFIIFEYPESRRRCLDDYHWSNYRNWCRYPKALQLKGRRLSVKPAPDPEDVLWENLEVTKAERFIRRLFVNFIMFIFLLISFAVIIALSTMKQKRLGNIPKLGMCASEIPALFLGSYNASITDLTMVRPGVFECSTCDLTCANSYNMAAYAVYSYSGNYLAPAVNYDTSGCADPCPTPFKSAQCPCVDPKGKHQCQTLSCYRPDAAHHICKTFDSSTLAGCYCYNSLKSIDVTNWFSRLKALAQDDVCSTLAESYTAVQALQILLSISTLLLNFALQVVTMGLSQFEHNDSSDVEASQLIAKIFVSQYINTALILLLVYGYSSNGDAIMKLFQKFNIFNGKYADFSPNWYGEVGTQLMTTALIATFTPHIAPLLQHFIILPFRRRMAKAAMIQGRPRYVMQQDLNALYVGPRFDVTMRYSQILNVIFFSMTFSAGMPILLVFALINFIFSYQFDRFLLLRFYARPPQRNERLQKVVNTALPYAVLIHLGVAVWMFGSDTIFGSYMVNSYLSTSLQEQTGGQLAADSVVRRIARSNVFPLFFFWVCLLGYLVVADLIPSVYLTEFLQWLWTLCHRVVVANPTAVYNMFMDNGFTKVFERAIPSDFAKAKVASPQGGGKYDEWDVYTYDDGSSVLRKLKSPGGHSPKAGAAAAAGALSPASRKSQCRKTWEVIKVNALHSYAMIRNAKYRDAVTIFMKEFTTKNDKERDSSGGEEQDPEAEEA